MKSAQDKILTYLLRWPSGLSTSRMRAWINSCTKHGGYTWREYEGALYALRDSGRVAFTNGVWWLKDIPPSMKENNEPKTRSKNTTPEITLPSLRSGRS